MAKESRNTDTVMYRIKRENYKKLQMLKIELDLKTINEVIEYLLKK